MDSVFAVTPNGRIDIAVGETYSTEARHNCEVVVNCSTRIGDLQPANSFLHCCGRIPWNLLVANLDMVLAAGNNEPANTRSLSREHLEPNPFDRSELTVICDARGH